MPDDLTVPLTHPVPAGEALLLEACREVRLPPEVRCGLRDEVIGAVAGLLGRLPAGTPEPLVDRLVDLLHEVDDLLDVSDWAFVPRVDTPDASH